MVKNPPANAGDLGSISGLRRSSGEGNGLPLQYSCLENPMDRGAWRAIVHGVAKSKTRLHFHFLFYFSFNSNTTNNRFYRSFQPIKMFCNSYRIFTVISIYVSIIPILHKRCGLVLRTTYISYGLT